MPASQHAFRFALSFLFLAALPSPAATTLNVWSRPAGGIEPSPHYAVTLRAGGQSATPFTYFSYNRPYDKTLDREGRYIKLGFLNLHSNEYRLPSANPDTYAHSWTSFDFSGGPVEVEVRVLQPVDGLTLPLTSCAVLPSAAGVACRVTARDTMRFQLHRPAKIAVVANHLAAAEQLIAASPKRAFEGYRNPLFLFARAPETNQPSKTDPGTLVVAPGRQFTSAELAKAGTLYFEPGLHDFSRIDGDEDHYLVLRKGQRLYLAGGAYLYAHLKSPIKTPIQDMPLVFGRGTLSGGKQRWSGLPYVTTVVIGLRLDGIQITDPHNHLTHTNGPLRDIAVVGAWHGNTDGPTLETPARETYSGIHVEDCFVMAADTNLKVGRATRVRHYVAWQLANAEPLWIRGADGVTVDDMHVIASNAWGRQVVNFRADSTNQKKALVRNLTIEAPYSGMPFFMPSDYTGPGQSFEDVVLENVTIATPHRAEKSQFGGGKNDRARLGRVVFRNLVINGTKVTAGNCRDYFELAAGVTVGKEIVFE